MSRHRGDDALAANPFGWRVTADRKVIVSRGGQHVVTVGGSRGSQLAARLETADDAAAQQLLARATGNYKRGNER